MSWIAIDSDPALVEKALAAFPNASIAVQSPRHDLDAIFALPGHERIRGLSLMFPKRAEIARYAKHKAIAKLVRLDVSNVVVHYD